MPGVFSRIGVVAVFTSLTAATATVPDAQAQSWKQRAFRAYALSPPYLRELARVLRIVDTRNRPFCDKRRAKRPLAFRILSLKFDRRRKPVSGRWGEVVHVLDCVRVVRYRVWFVLEPGKKLKGFAAVPGTTRTDMFEMRAGMEKVMALASRAVVGCDKIRFVGSTATRTTGKKRPAGTAWTEKWDTVVCGSARRYLLHFGKRSKGKPPTVTVEAMPLDAG